MLLMTHNQTRLLWWQRAVRVMRLCLVAIVIAISYYLGEQLGRILHFPKTEILLLWPPGAILLTVLLLTPPQRWPLWLLAAAAADFAAHWLLGASLGRQAVDFVQNVTLALLTATVLRRFAPEALRFTTYRSVLAFLLVVVCAALASAGAGAIVSATIGITATLGQAWWQSACATILACLTLLPALLLLFQNWHLWQRHATAKRVFEAACLAVVLLTSGAIVFGVLPAGPASGTYIRMGIMPLLLWAAVRFGPGGFSLALSAISLLAIWNTSLGNGPFVRASPTQNVLNLQTEFLAFAAPLLVLTALIAQRQRDEAALTQSNAQLEDRVARRTAELARINAQLVRARDQAEQASQVKSDFLATMSHELRTPLHTIMGYNQLMLNSSGLPRHQQQQALVVQQSADHLLTLINSVLDLARIEASQTQVQATSTELPQLLTELVEMFRPQASSKRLALHYLPTSSLPSTVLVDAVKLRQILINLVGNAIKFTEFGSVTLTVCCEGHDSPPQPDAKPAAFLVFEVADTGPGITGEDQQHIFEPFIQTQAGQHTGEGSGLGLALTQRFVHLMDGELGVRSVYGRGAVFTVRIPVHIAPTVSTAQRSGSTQPVVVPAPGQPQCRVLVVDDNRDNRRLLTAILAALGIPVCEAHDYTTAIAMWQEWQPQCIFLDMRLGQESGLTVARHIRQTAGVTPVIVALSANSFGADSAAAQTAGCNEFIRKPFKPTAIRAALERLLGLRFQASGQLAQAVPGAALDPVLLAALPATLLARLEQVSIEGNPQQITTVITEIGTHTAELAETLQTLADQLAFDLILQAVRGVVHTEATR